MEKQIELNIEDLRNASMFRDLLDVEVVLVGGGDVVLVGN
jgi:hypothetical protein